MYVYRHVVKPTNNYYASYMQLPVSQSGDFKRIGILVGMSLIQGGSGFPFFAPSMYDYICGKDICDIKPTIEEVPDAQLKATLTEVHLHVIFHTEYLLS